MTEIRNVFELAAKVVPAGSQMGWLKLYNMVPAPCQPENAVVWLFIVILQDPILLLNIVGPSGITASTFQTLFAGTVCTVEISNTWLNWSVWLCNLFAMGKTKLKKRKNKWRMSKEFNTG